MKYDHGEKSDNEVQYDRDIFKRQIDASKEIRIKQKATEERQPRECTLVAA